MNPVPVHDSLRLHATALQLRSQRQQVLASNLANADTPGYLARDMDFDSALRARLAGVPESTRLPLATTHAGHAVSPRDGGLEAPVLLYRTALQPAIDGNTVDADVERAHFAENTTRFEAAAALLQSTVRSRQMALSGQT